MPDSLPNIQEHAKKLLDQAIAAGRIAPEPGEVPAFSQGTATLEQDGTPVVQQASQPDFQATRVAIPEGEEANAALRAPQATEQTPTLQPAPEAQPAAAQAAQATDAAAAAAQQIADEFEDWEFEDPDLEGVKVPLRFPKKHAQIIKRAFPRRADYDRMKQRMGEAAPVLEPLLLDGRIKQILPLIQSAFQNQAYGNYVWQGFERLQRGLPLIEEAIREATRQAAPVQDQSGSLADLNIQDPYLGEVIQPVVGRLQQFEQTVNQRLQTWEQQQADQRRQAEEQARQQTEISNAMMSAHQDLSAWYPNNFRFDQGPNDPAWKAAVEYANRAGFIQSYGWHRGIVHGAQAWMRMEQERLAATSSPAAAALASVNNQQIEHARQQAAAAAASVGGGATGQSVAPPAPKAPSTRNVDGSLKSPDQYIREQADFIARSRGAR